MAARSLSSGQVSEITQCPICTEPFNEPKVLPCIHTFCLHCLKKYGEEKEIDTGDKVKCPLCRREFSIPQGGFKELPNNYFIIQLMQISQAPRNTSEDQPQTKLTCKHHLAKEIEFYCYDCKMTACVVCFKETHNKHKWAYIDESAKELGKQVKEDIEKVTPYILKSREELAKIDEDKTELISKVKTTKLEISEKYEQIRSLLKAGMDQFNKELNSYEERVVKELEKRKDEVEAQLFGLESFKRYCEEMEKKGTSCDISRAADDLHTRAMELLKTQEELISRPTSVSSVDIKFTASETTSESLIGQLSFASVVADKKKKDKVVRNNDFNSMSFLDKSSTVAFVIPKKGIVHGIAVVGDQVCVVGLRNGESHIDVYDSKNLNTTPRQLKIGDTKSVRTFFRKIVGSSKQSYLCISGCSQYNCVHVSKFNEEDLEESYIRRVELSNSSMIKWIVKGGCVGLSATNNSNLLAMLYSGRIQEYTTHGTLLKEISLDSSIDYALHCVQLSDGTFVVSHSGLLEQRVCIVDTSGQILRSYGGLSGSAEGRLGEPCQLAVDKYDNVIVADNSNNRVVLLSRTLTLLGNILTQGHEIKDPHSLCLDRINRRLYIGELEEPLLVIDSIV